MSSFSFSARAPIMSSAFAGSGGKSLPMKGDKHRTYILIEESAIEQEHEEEGVGNAQRLYEELPPVRHSRATEATRSVKKFVRRIEAARKARTVAFKKGWRSYDGQLEGC
ncbi:MAG: hypothetical protein Q9213_006201 [Squamulea squamosa]